MTSQTKTEIVCIKRQGFSILHTKGADFAAEVVQQAYTPGEIFDPRIGVQQTWLVPLYPPAWG